LLATVAAILHRGMESWALLADDWKTSRAAAWHVDGTSGSSSTSAQHQAGSHVVIAVPVINPALRVRTRALECQCGGIEEVINAHVGKMHAERSADGIGLATGDGSVHNDQVALLHRASLARAGRKVVSLRDGIHPDACVSTIIRRILDHNANVMPARK